MLNSVNLQARLVKDVELFTKEDKCFAVMRVATESNMTNTDGEHGSVFLDCVIFGKSAEAAKKHLAKGQQVIISGSLNQKTYTNKAGQAVTTTEVIVDRWHFCEPKQNTQDTGEVKEDELPFNKGEAPQQPRKQGYTKR